MEHQKPSVLSPAGHHPHMGQVGIEGQKSPGRASAQSTGAHRARWARTPLPTAAKAAGSPAASATGATTQTKPEQSSPKRQALPAGAAARGGDHRRDAPARIPPHRVRLAAPRSSPPAPPGRPRSPQRPGAGGGQLRRKGGGDALPHLALGQRRGDGWDRSTEEQPRQHPGQQQKDGQVGPDGAATPPHAPAAPAGPPDCARCPRLNSAPPAPPAPARPWSR